MSIPTPSSPRAPRLRAVIGDHLAGPLFDHYRRLSESRPYTPDAAERRAARVAQCLSRSSGGDRATGRHRRWPLNNIEAADNMTDRMAALSTLSLHDVPERTAALDDFYTRYRDDPLIVDKWFTLQATIPEPATLDRVKALTGHAAFSIANPNRVRALIDAFALAIRNSSTAPTAPATTSSPIRCWRSIARTRNSRRACCPP